MRTPKILTLAIISLITLSGCSKPGTTPENPLDLTSIPSKSDHVIIANTPFQLSLGESASFQPNNLTVAFTQVKSDSRCPSDVTCVWAGEATVHVKITGFNYSNEADLVIPGTDKDTIKLDLEGARKFSLKLTELSPYPNTKNPTEKELNKATFILEVQG